MNLTYVPSLTVSGSEGSRPGPWAPAANRLRRSRKKVIYSLVPAVSRTFFKKVSYSRPRAPLGGPLADSVPPFRGAPSSEGLAIIPRIGGIASVFRDFFRLVDNCFEQPQVRAFRSFSISSHCRQARLLVSPFTNLQLQQELNGSPYPETVS